MVYISALILAIASAGLAVFLKLIPRDKFSSMDILPLSNILTGIIILIVAISIEKGNIIFRV